jgi:hypothetical protein
MNWYKLSKLEEKWWNNIYYHILNASDLILKEHNLIIDRSSFVVFLDQDVLTVSFWSLFKNKQYKCIIDLKLSGVGLENHDYLILNGNKQKDIDLNNTNLLKVNWTVLGKQNNEYYIAGKGVLNNVSNPASIILSLRDAILKDKGFNGDNENGNDNSPITPISPDSGLKKTVLV